MAPSVLCRPGVETGKRGCQRDDAGRGIRGTEFWGGPIDDQALGVFLIEGAVSVSNAAGQQVLNLPGQGTNIAAAGAAPGLVTFWPRDKIGRAMATVTFR